MERTSQVARPPLGDIQMPRKRRGFREYLMNIQETVAMLRECLQVKQGSTTNVATWEAKPILTVRYLGADSEYTFIDTGGEMEYDFDSPPSGQLADHCRASLGMWLISTGAPKVKALAEWLEVTHDAGYYEYTNGELMNFVWMEKHIPRKGRDVHRELSNLTEMRSVYLQDNEALAEAIAQENN